MQGRFLTTLILLAAAAPARAEVRLPAVFSDHMVLQRGVQVPVWGWAAPGEEVTVSIAGQTQKTRAGADGKWMLRLDPIGAPDPLRMTVRGASGAITVEDVLAGEVWLGSGQSNMAMRVAAAKDYEQERARVGQPRIRMFTVESEFATSPREDVKGRWIAAAPDTVGQFSATGYFFARELHAALDAPAGFINASVGGTAIELWIAEQTQRAAPELRPAVALLDKMRAAFDRTAAARQYQAERAKWEAAAAAARQTGQPAPLDPVALFDRKTAMGPLFNGMIAPLIPYALRGALWYQGEANSTPDRAGFYRDQLPLLVNDWRARWGQGAFPFAWVQLPNFNAPDRNWPLLREGMLEALRTPNTGMAVTIDIGEANNIHPKNKQDVGKRLAMWALGAVYGRQIETSGPLPGRAEIGENEIIISFTHTTGGLTARGGALRGFEIAGWDRKWVPAEAVIRGERVVVASPDVKPPAAARYAWANNPEGNLYNGAGLPATPFRTDAWR